VRRAILRRQPVAAGYRGRSITLYPHALGWRDGKHVVLALLARPRTRTDASAPPWEWVSVPELRNVAIQEGLWRTGPHPPTDLLDILEAVAL
jgi:hypothetical protein